MEKSFIVLGMVLLLMSSIEITTSTGSIIPILEEVSNSTLEYFENNETTAETLDVVNKFDFNGIGMSPTELTIDSCLEISNLTIQETKMNGLVQLTIALKVDDFTDFRNSCLIVKSQPENCLGSLFRKECDFFKDSSKNVVSDLCSGQLYVVELDFFCHGMIENITVEYKTQPSAPSAPRMLDINSTTSSSATITWLKPEKLNGPLDGYLVSWSSLDGYGNKTIANSSIDSITINNLWSATTYNVKLTAFNYLNEFLQLMSPPIEINVTTDFEIPGSPTNLSVINVTSTSLLISWDAPTNGESNSTQYTIQILSSNLKKTIITNTTNTQYLIEHLSPLTMYEIRVRSWNVAGHSDWVSIKEETDVTVPSIPEGITVAKVDWSSILLRWKAPKSLPGTRVDGYELQYVPSTMDKDLEFVILLANMTQHKIWRLDPFTEYDLKLSSFSRSKSGRWLSSPQAVIKQKTDEYYPDPVSNVTVLFVTNTSFTLRWNPPVNPNGIITLYTILLFNGSSQASVSSTNNTEIVIEDLLPYTAYSFLIYAKNSHGIGNFSKIASITTDVGEPSVPELFNIRSTATKMFLVWIDPMYRAGPIDGYQVSWTNAQGSKQVHGSMNVNITSFNISTLSPWTEYIVGVKAYNINSQKVLLFGKETILRKRTLADFPPPPVVTLVEVQSSSSVWVEWDNNGEYPGPTMYVLEVWQNPDVCHGRSGEDKLVKNHTNDAISWKVSTTVIRDLRPYTVYFFVVVVSTNAGTSRSNKSQTVLTHSAAPSEPRKFAVNCSFSSTAVLLTWDSPEQKNGIIEKYNITYSSNTDPKPKEKIFVVKPVLACESRRHVTELSRLHPETQYKFFIQGKTKGVDQYGPLITYNRPCTLPAGVPPIPDNSSTPEVEETSDQEVILKWSKTMFSSEMGQIMYYAVIVATPSIIGVARNGSVKDIEPLPVWAEFFNQGSNIYQATPLDWNPFHTSVYDPLNCRLSQDKTLQCVIGWEKNCTAHTKTYCNGPLGPGKLYGMKLRGFTKAGFAETYPFFVKTESADKSVVLGLSIGLVMTCVILFVIASAYVVLKKRQKVRALNDVKRISNKLIKTEPVMSLAALSNEEVIEIEAKEPYDFPTFLKHIKVMMSDSALKFSLEYETLKKSSPRHSCTAAEMEENRGKNRWTNILPFDHSRVKLLPIDDEPGSDYINASYIPGYSSHREYIASQGPLPSTIDDFWRMVWEQKITMIVMLTQCVERGKVKCERYWPKIENDPTCYGDLKVCLTDETTFAAYSTRTLSVTLGARQSTVTQMHYTKWPDFGCPESTDELVNFVKAVKEQIPEGSSAPILVHCSAGVGRTGTFITVDRLLQHVQCHKDIDIYNTVLQMREHRTNMVQTEDQYIYIHKCLCGIIREQMENEKGNSLNIGVNGYTEPERSDV